MKNLTEMTTENIRALAVEAVEAGDDAQASLCATELRQRGAVVLAEDLETLLALRAVAEILRSEGDWAHGGNIHGTAREWVELGFAPSQVRAWLNARCFEPVSAVKLQAAGISPKQAAIVVYVGQGSYREMVGYAVSNGDMTIAEARLVLV